VDFIAAETYDNLASHRSLVLVLRRFLFDTKHSLYLRVLRDGGRSSLQKYE
jgi:hypothetical protein